MKSGGTLGFEQKWRGALCEYWWKRFLGGGIGQAKCKALNTKCNGTGSPVIKRAVRGGGRKREKFRMSSKFLT